MSRYYVSATFRADGSSKFGDGNRWGFFPTASVAWRISDEKFMKFAENWLNDLKIRFSFGVAGNNNIPSGLIQQLYNPNATSWINGVSSYWAPSKTMANPDLKWETTYTRNLGLDYSFLRGRINGTVEFYWNTTKDLLIQYPVAGTGYDYQYRNMGKTSNKGIEFTINGVIVDKKDWGINVGANISFNKNKVEDLGDLQSIDNIATGWASTEIDQDFIIKTGEPIGQIYGYQGAGRYEVSDFDIAASQAKGTWVLKSGVPDASTVIGTPVRPGSMKIGDTNGDGKITTDDRTIIGDTNPTCTGGFNINARYKDFDFAANFNYSLGNDIYNANFIEYTQTGKYRYRNMITEVEDGKRWTNIDAAGNLLDWNSAEQLAALNVNTSKPSPYTGKYVLTSDYVQKASYLRLGTVTLGYTIPKKYTQMVHLSNVRVYFTGYNLLTFTGYDGTDPEVNSIRRTNLTPGVDYSAYPKSRQYVFGINVNL
jgi:TonB-linked SusC/RagA family outer membrane protein